MWQHCDCVKVKPDVESYLCEKCSKRKMSGEVELIPPPDDGIPEYKYYLSLEHGNVHVAIGDAVYMTPSDPNLGIYAYRVERLWKDPRYAYILIRQSQLGWSGQVVMWLYFFKGRQIRVRVFLLLAMETTQQDRHDQKVLSQRSGADHVLRHSAAAQCQVSLLCG